MIIFNGALLSGGMNIPIKTVGLKLVPERYLLAVSYFREYNVGISNS